MVMGKEIASAALMAFALLAGPGGKADAAQCGSSAGGFESWKQEFAAEARGKGVGANATAALMQTTYASATINADRSQRSFSLTLDQFLAKRRQQMRLAAAWIAECQYVLTPIDERSI